MVSRLISVLFILYIAVSFAFAQQSQPLILGEKLEKTISKGEVQKFNFTLKANQFARLEVQQKGMIVNFEILDAQQNRLLRVSRPLHHFARKIASVLAQTDSEFYVVISNSTTENQPNNQYSIKISEIREAKSLDKLQIETEAAFMDFPNEFIPLAERENYFQKYEKVVADFEKTGDRWYQSFALILLGRAYGLHNNRQKGIKYFQKSLDLQKKHQVNEVAFESQAYFFSGISYNFIGEPQMALDSLQKSLELEKSINNTERSAEILNQIGNVYLETGSYQKALLYYQQSLSVLERPAVRVRRNIGLAYAGLGEYDKALENFKLFSPKLDLEKPTLLNNNSLLHQVAQIYSKQGKYEKAKIFYEAVAKYYRDGGLEYGQAIALTGLGNVYHKLNESEKALQVLREAIPLREKGNNRAGEALTRYLIAKIQTDKGNLDEALSEIDKTIRLTEDLREKISGDEARIEYLSSVFDYYELYIEILFRLHQKNPKSKYDEKAFQISEKVRARGIIELINYSNAEISRGVSPELKQKERDLQSKINELARVKTDENAENKNENVDVTLNNLFSEISEVRTQIRRQNPQYAALTQNLPTVSLEELQNNILDSDTILLEYKLGKERSFLWSVGDKAFALYELPKKEIIENKAKEVYSLLTARQQKSFNKETESRLAVALEELSKLILAPIENDLKKKRIVVVADGALQYIPFAALKFDGKYLIESSQILNLPSATFLSELRKKEKEKAENKKLLAVIADPVFDSKDSRLSVSQKISSDENALPRLLFSRQEATAIAAIVPKKDLLLAMDFAANKTTATSENLAQYRIVHFATHGFLDSEHPELSGLAFSMLDQKGNPQNGFLRLHEIYNLRMPADLVVLSGCQTGLGKEVRGEGLIGLTRGFMYAGASRVAASLWQIDDSATAELMKYFYIAMLTEKRTPAEALRQAQLQMLAQKRWQNPYFWASFTIQGDWR